MDGGTDACKKFTLHSVKSDRPSTTSSSANSASSPQTDSVHKESRSTILPRTHGWCRRGVAAVIFFDRPVIYDQATGNDPLSASGGNSNESYYLRIVSCE